MNWGSRGRILKENMDTERYLDGWKGTKHTFFLEILVQRLEFQRITAQQTQVYLRCGAEVLSMDYTVKYWTCLPDLSLLSVRIINLYSDGKWKSEGREAFFWPIAFSHLYDRTLGQIHIHRMTKISDSGKREKIKAYTKQPTLFLYTFVDATL